MSSDAPTVWIYSDVFPPAVAGAAYMVETWTRQLSEQGFKVRNFFPSGVKDAWRTPEQVAFKTWKDVAYVGDEHARFSSLLEIRRAKDELPDAIVVATPGRVGMLGLATAQRYDVPLIMIYSTDLVGALEFYDSRKAVLATFSKVVAMGVASKKLRSRFLDVRAFLNHNTETKISQRAPFHLLRACQVGAEAALLLNKKRMPMVQSWAPDVPLHLIPSGVDRLPESEKPAELVWNEGALRVVYVGRYAREKNLRPVVEGVALAKADGVDVHVHLVGHGELGEELAALAKELGVADRVSFIGPYKRHELRGIYGDADVFVFASVSDTQGFVLNEAAHESLPLLVSDPGVNPVVSEGESAVVVPPTGRGYADGYRELSDPELRGKLGERAQALAEDCSEARQSAKLAAIIRDHLRPRAGAR